MKNDGIPLFQVNFDHSGNSVAFYFVTGSENYYFLTTLTSVVEM